MRQSRFAFPKVLRKPMSVTPSISSPRSTTKFPEAICSLSTCAGTLVVIHAGSVLGLKPSSSGLHPLSAAAKPIFTIPGALAVEFMLMPGLAGGAACGAKAETPVDGCRVSGVKPLGVEECVGANCSGAGDGAGADC